MCSCAFARVAANERITSLMSSHFKNISLLSFLLIPVCLRVWDGKFSECFIRQDRSLRLILRYIRLREVDIHIKNGTVEEYYLVLLIAEVDNLKYILG